MRGPVVGWAAAYSCGAVGMLCLGMYKKGQVEGAQWLWDVLEDRTRPSMLALARSQPMVHWRKAFQNMMAMHPFEFTMEGFVLADVIKADPVFADAPAWFLATSWMVPSCWLKWVPTGERCVDKDRGLLKHLQPFVPTQFGTEVKRVQAEDGDQRPFQKQPLWLQEWFALNSLLESRITHDTVRTPYPTAKNLPFLLRFAFNEGVESAKVKGTNYVSQLRKSEDLAWAAAHCPSVRYYLHVADEAVVNHSRMPEFDELFVPADAPLTRVHV